MKAVLFYRQQQKWYADNLPIEDRSARNQSDDVTSGDLFSTYKWFTFALAVGMDYAYFKAAFQCLGFHCEGQDFLLDSILVKLGDKRDITQELFDPKTYGKLVAALHAPVNTQANAMNHYLNYWYRTNEIKEIHIDTVDGYYGYWCYEAALITRLWQLDYSVWRDHPYYPRDLVK